LTHYCTAAIGFVSQNLPSHVTLVGASPTRANQLYEKDGSQASNV
jgi:hypothetical protein